MRLSLRWRILAFTVLPPVALAMGTLWTVNMRVSQQAEQSIRESLSRSSRLFEDMMAARAEALGVAGGVIVRDPRFFSILTLPVSHTDAQYRRTVQGVASDFNRITHVDLFDVMDRNGLLLASVGRLNSSRANRQSMVRQALRGSASTAVLVEGKIQCQVSVTPVQADGRVVGVLMLGTRIDTDLARQLRDLTRSEVTFLSGGRPTGSSLELAGDQASLARGVRQLGAGVQRHVRSREVIEMAGASESYLTLLRTIPGSTDGGEQLYVMQRGRSSEMAYLKPIRNGLMQLGLAAVLIALLIGLVISEYITRPVRRLVRVAEEMKRGNYEYPLDVRTRDEIGDLAGRFDEMRRREKEYVASLQEVARLKSEFISVASHELRTPISVIKAYHDLLVGEDLGPITQHQREAFNAIERSVIGLLRIADDATQVAQIEGERLLLSIGEHAVHDVIEQGVTEAATDAPSRILNMTIEIEPHLPKVRVDGRRVAQAVANLVRNAIRFTPDGGEVHITTRREGSELVVKVRDTGVGIPEERQKDLFTRSVMVRNSLNHHSSTTLEYNSQGLGLGLSIVRGIADAHGGSVAVTSRTGEGSTFVLRMPLDCTPAQSEAA